MKILLAVDGSAYTRTIIFGAAKLVSYVSRFMTLLGIEGLGEQRQLVVPFKL